MKQKGYMPTAENPPGMPQDADTMGITLRSNESVKIHTDSDAVEISLYVRRVEPDKYFTVATLDDKDPFVSALVSNFLADLNDYRIAQALTTARK